MRSSPLLSALVGLVAACKSTPAADQQPGGGGGGAPPPTEVGVVTLKSEQVTLQAELPGRTVAALTSDVRPQVSGLLKARLFEEGSRVKAGQVLYRIDAAMYRAQVDQAAADLANAKAQLDQAKGRNERYAKLSEIEGVSKQEADDARALFQQATAAVAQKQAVLQAARININYTAITAPISGRIGKSAVTVGALVTANQPQPLAVIRSLDPMFVELTESSEERLRLRSALGAGKLKAGSTKVKLKLSDGSIYGHDGTLEFTEVAVDEATGMVTLRAQFPNPDDTLLPGMYVRAVLDQAVAQEAILAPQQGVSHDAKGNPVAMVVGANNMVEPRVLTAERAIGDRWLVTSGLRAGDKLIVEGLNKIGPGMPVNPVEVTPKPAGDAGAAPAAGSAAGSDAGSDASSAPPATTPASAVKPIEESAKPAAGSAAPATSPTN
ncbi:MAG TPA: efflux RND transporter periplasmic adaptor subunit [Kofleriaceae bacterium]|nr:efflux RND transporter periplasmic adaptor subunit [Kofleriaceae bacterium]